MDKSINSNEFHDILTFEERLDAVVTHVCNLFGHKNSQTFLFKKLGDTHSSSFSLWKKRGFVSKKPLQILKNEFGINPEWLNNGLGDMLLLHNNMSPRLKPTKSEAFALAKEALDKINFNQEQEIRRLREENEDLKNMIINLSKKINN